MGGMGWAEDGHKVCGNEWGWVGAMKVVQSLCTGA